MNVIDMPLKVGFIANLVLPISPLPDPGLAFEVPAGADQFVTGNRA